jgi:hypothetical protein
LLCVYQGFYYHDNRKGHRGKRKEEIGKRKEERAESGKAAPLFPDF